MDVRDPQDQPTSAEAPKPPMFLPLVYRLRSYGVPVGEQESVALAEALAPGRAVRMALNQVLSDETALLTDGAEVAFFPPVTGG